MALDTNATKLAQMIDPEVLAPMIDKKLTDDMKFAPLCRIDTTLVGRPGTTVTLPSWNYIGDATTVAEGADIPISQLTKSTATVTIAKVGKGLQITDEALLAGYGDPMGEIAKQIRLAIASKLDNDVLGILHNIAAGMTYTGAAAGLLTPDDIADALTLFGEDIDGSKAILMCPAQYAVLRKAKDWIPASEVAAQAILRGMVGEIYGCQVVVTNKLATTQEAYIVKPEALAIYLKRDTTVEYDRDIINDTTYITANKHYAPYLYDASRAIKLVKNS